MEQLYKKNGILCLLMARRNYDVAKILDKNKILDRFYIDFYNRSPALKFIDSIFSKKKIFKKYDPGLSKNKIVYNNLEGFLFRLSFFINKYVVSFIEVYIYKRKASRIENKYFSNDHFFYGVDTSMLEIFKKAHKKGGIKILEQCIAPRESQIKILKNLNSKYGHICNSDEFFLLEKYSNREKEEWDLSDIIIAPSLFVYNSLINSGVNKNKIRIVPYGFTNDTNFNFDKNLETRINSYKKFRILFVGNTTYRKGLYDLIDLANQCLNLNFEFTFVGNMKLNNSDLPINCKATGSLNKLELNKLYSNSHAFVFPSYLEGSALVNYEALSFGLPVITTYESGSPIENNLSGFIVQPGEVDKILKILIQLSTDITQYTRISTSALELSSSLTLKKYEENLLKIITEINERF